LAGKPHSYWGFVQFGGSACSLQSKVSSINLHIAFAEIVTIGDQPNDMVMFNRSGMSIAMGRTPDEVTAAATAVTASNNDEGFAEIMERLVLGEDR
jgi:hydroxymethylpyrimidine pyrophosphatase-like HAD family hydrolase